jgi:RNA polymerase sigma factor (sigma-70 family)
MRSRCLSVDPNMALIGFLPSEETLLKITPCWKQAICETGPQTATFEGLALPLLPSLYNIAFWLSRNAADAEDLVQEAFLKALRGFATFKKGSNFKAWIFRILRNTYLTSRAGLAAARTIPLEEESDCRNEWGSAPLPDGAIDRENPEMHLIRLNDRAELRQAMENLATPLLEVILLCDMEEMKYREIAIVLEIPIGTVMSRIARARTALRATLISNMTSRGEFRI